MAGEVRASRHFQFSRKVTLICGILVLGMVRLSAWQWDRHLEKQEIIRHLDNNLRLPAVPLTELATQAGDDWSTVVHRRVEVHGTYDFENEMVLRNRRFETFSGVHVLTPLKIGGTATTVLVDRGFVPLANASRDLRKQYRHGTDANFIGLVKPSMPRKFFSPPDPPTRSGEWVDAWLRVDLPAMQPQLPYPVLPVYLEIMNTDDLEAAKKQIVRSSGKDRDDILNLAERGITTNRGMEVPDLPFPIAMFDAVIPPGRHLGYVYEWAFMALLTTLTGLVLQFRRTPMTLPPENRETEARIPGMT